MFDLDSAESLLSYIDQSLKNYSSQKSKRVSELFFLIMSLTHLREWIAPGYKMNKSNHWPDPKNDAEVFSRKIYSLQDYDLLRRVCNGTKHLSGGRPDTSATHGLNIDDWDDFDGVRIVDEGPPSDFYIGDENIYEIMVRVFNYYHHNWFHKNDPA